MGGISQSSFRRQGVGGVCNPRPETFLINRMTGLNSITRPRVVEFPDHTCL